MKLRAKFGVMRGGIAGAGFAFLFCVFAAAQARAANWFEKNFWMSGPEYSRDVPSCDSHPALDRIIADFRTKEFRFWNSELRIVGFENIQETNFMPWAAQSIPRRFCHGMVVINDNTRHKIFYSIAEDTGMIGMDWGVNFCVDGLDRSDAYGAGCRAAQP